MAGEGLKEQGNAAFAAGDFTKAIQLYGDAINLAAKDAGGVHILYSNRSAAFLARAAPGDTLNALSDANAAIRLNAGFAKAYGRKGAALVALGQLEEAVAALAAGIRLDPNNASLKETMAAAQAALSASRMKQGSAAAAGQGDGDRAAAANQAAAPAAEEDPMAAFMAEISSLQPVKPPVAMSSSAMSKSSAREEVVKSAASSSAARDDDDTDNEDGGVLSVVPTGKPTAGPGGVPLIVSSLSPVDAAATAAKIAAQDLGTSAQAIDRVMQRNHKWINLNPFDVLALPHTASADDIKGRYRKLSALVHPDKAPDDARAPDAFQEVHKAYEQLQDPSRWNIVVIHIDSAARALRKDRRKRIKAGTPEHALPPFDEELTRETRKLFAELEQRRINYEMRVKNEAAREAEKQYDEMEKGRADMREEKEWAVGREARKETWHEFEAAHKKKRVDAGGAAEAVRFGAVAGGGGAEDYKRKWR